MATPTAVDVVMPQMGVSVSEGTITKWLKQEGEEIQADEPLLEISTDKVDTEVPSPGTGVVQQILVQEGETVDVGTRLAVIGAPGAAPAESSDGAAPAAEEAPPEPATAQAAAESEAAASAETPTPQEPEAAPAEPPTPAPAPAPAEPGANGDGKSFVSPVVARIASEHGVDVSQVPGHRPRRPRDEEGHPRLRRVRRPGRRSRPPKAPPPPEAAAPAAPAEAPAQPAPAPEAPAPAQPAQPPHRRLHLHRLRHRLPPRRPASSRPGENEEPMTAMRKGIAEHMRRSLDTSAHVTSAIEVDMSRVVDIRNKLKPELQKSYGVNPTYLIFVARAVTETLREYPWINGEIRGDKIVTRNFINLGFAVELADGKGLIVPVVKHAEGLNLLGMAQAVTDIAERARNKQLSPDEVQGGTFTITNPGGYGTFHGTPVISQPQAAILGTYALVKRPWVVQDELGKDVIAIRPIMNLTLTYDHRLVDGALAGRFLQSLRQKLESWGESDY